MPALRGYKITLILLHIFSATEAVNQALTIFGKDCGQHRLKSISRLAGGPKLTLVQAQESQRRAH
jgi:hypothetical protein